MKRNICFTIFIILTFSCFSQESLIDSSKTLDEVKVNSFEQNKKVGSSVAAIAIVHFNNADRYHKTSLVNAFNTVAGVRMEERSPGSYRINIRGSSLRSPFGVRNVKVYWNDIPITDASGNTYFNQFAYNNFSYLEISKGPAASMYGSGTGGLLLLHNLDRWQPGCSLEYITGSYHLQNVFVSGRWGKNGNKNQITYAHNQTDSYRNQSKLKRDNFSWQSVLKASEKQEISVSILYNNMFYETPGALTLAEYNTNAKAARPASGNLPSAQDAHAAIFQKNIMAGFTNKIQFSTAIKNSTTLYANFSDIKNSAIRNYEQRTEPGYGGRTVFSYNKKYNIEKENSLQLVAGAEFQQGFFNTAVSQNKNGQPGNLLTHDDINYINYIFFTQAELRIHEKWLLNVGIGLNKSSVKLKRLNVSPVKTQFRNYANEFAPRIAIRKNFTDWLYVKAAISRGYSAATTAELLPSTGVINTMLEAEHGWNYETILHADLLHKKLQVEITGFYFKLRDALVQRRDSSGADYFVNAGKLHQKGMELSLSYLKTDGPTSILDYYQFSLAYTFNHFRYGSFIKGNNNFSGKKIPSVPAQALSLLADFKFKKGFYLNSTFYSASKIFLNDANTAFADAYYLLGCRAGWQRNKTRLCKIALYAGVDNLLNEKYSLGNDINASANRFYNAAAARNYYLGVSFQWLNAAKNKPR